MSSTLDAFLLVPLASVCSDVDEARRAATEATTAVESRLRRRLIVQPAAQAVGDPPARGVPGWLQRSGILQPAPWARQWPVVLVTDAEPSSAEPLDAPPTELGGAYYADAVAAGSGDVLDPRLGDETGERIGLPTWPESGRVLYLAGYRRPDQNATGGRAQINAAIAERTPAWGSEAVSAATWARVPVLPAEITTAALQLARGYLQRDAAGLTALASRSQKRADAESRVQYRAGWDDEILARLDHLAWCDL